MLRATAPAGVAGAPIDRVGRSGRTQWRRHADRALPDTRRRATAPLAARKRRSRGSRRRRTTIRRTRRTGRATPSPRTRGGGIFLVPLRLAHQSRRSRRPRGRGTGSGPWQMSWRVYRPVGRRPRGLTNSTEQRPGGSIAAPRKGVQDESYGKTTSVEWITCAFEPVVPHVVHQSSAPGRSSALGSKLPRNLHCDHGRANPRSAGRENALAAASPNRRRPLRSPVEHIRRHEVSTAV